MKDNFKFKEWLNTAFLQVIKQAIVTIEQNNGLGEHYFYINFTTTNQDVVMEDFLRKQYPQNITIILQNQFSNVYTNDKGFGVSLMFQNKLSNLFIPWQAINSFYNPFLEINLIVNNFNSKITQHKIVQEIDDVLLQLDLKKVVNQLDIKNSIQTSKTSKKVASRSKISNSKANKNNSSSDTSNIIMFPNFK